MAALHHKARSRNRLAWWAAPLFAMGLASCEKPVVVAPKPKARVRLQAFTEALPVRTVAATSKYLFVTSGVGLDRWNLESEERLPLTHEHGLPGTNVFAMTYDLDRDWLWVATDVGISRYEVGTSTFSEMPAPAEVLGIDSFEDSVLAPARDGGLWVGRSNGLFYLQPGRGWTKTGVESKVLALYPDALGALWIGTESGLLRVNASGVAHRMESDEACAIANVTSLARFDDQHVVLLATSRDGAQVVALASDVGCATFASRETSATSDRFLGLTSDSAHSFVLTSDRLFELKLAKAAKPVLLESGAESELKLKGKSAAMALSGELTLVPLPARIPPNVGTVQASQTALYLTAGRLGTMEWKLAQGDRPGRWFRRRELAADADTLTVACSSEDVCYLATAARTESNAIWKWDGEGFSHMNDSARVFGVLALDDDRILSIAEPDATGDSQATNGRDGIEGKGAALVIRVLDGDRWKPVPGAIIRTPGKGIRVKALRQAPDGQVWVSLDHLDEAGESTPYGLAVLDLNLGYVVYHRASFDEKATKMGILPVPVDITDMGFVGEDEVWLASSQGATRVVGTDIKTHIEADGLRTELLEGLVCSSGGMVYTASTRGVGEWNGERWTYPAAMRTSINDLAIGRNGQLWLATDKGLGVYDGAKVRRLDTKQGLVDNRIMDLESDRYGRIWALSAQGIVLVSP